ncbi:peptide chain release factor N(5)-glutamine methyltransferase [Oceanobacillus bengalensis]|uniref:Release factor glutamine methyltransferase n=1 Tax=Oceanobacillus bengalensis TaxID=1435466 RepID=A0A494YYX8_9BACI|nr:peptide chain release factor N(5)-glutamine methyltransferase [Oceanobacillus bengalensis]RKQ15376.1 peptide chain release factor N(5)-glutamine methyltransferase [Oceanobacillus bengalensis]
MSEKLYEVLKRASLFLDEYNRESKVAEILLQHHLRISRSEFFMKMQDPVPSSVIERFEKDLQLHAETGIPVQHLTGNEMFYGRKFQVNNHVLIPRPETEELVLHIIELVKKKYTENPITIVDIGTGSGVIAITLALELPQATVYATDISSEALSIAKNNADRLKANVHFLQGDFAQPLIDENIQADIIVSNPPYIAESEKAAMDDTVKNFDPALALFADEEGLAAYRRIIQQAPKVLKRQAQIAFEIGYKQSADIQEIIMQRFPTAEVRCLKDINGKDRIVSARIF